MRAPYLSHILKALLLALCVVVVSCTTNEDGGDFSFESEIEEEFEGVDDSSDDLAVEDGEFNEFESEDIADEDIDDEEIDDDDIDEEEIADEDDEFLNFGEEGSSVAENSEVEETPSFEEASQPVDEPPLYPEEDESEVLVAEEVPVGGDLPLAEDNGVGAAGAITSKESYPGPEAFESLEANTEAIPEEDLGRSDPLVQDVDPPAPSTEAARQIVPVAKVRENPFFRNGRVMNTVYIARPDDTLEDVSQKIFATPAKAEILLEDNPKLSVDLDPGDKVYYNSPNRSQDYKSIITYYEDTGLTPSYYTTNEGDDIQRIGKKLLGFENAWREIFATNPTLQTQAMLPAGIKVAYWSGEKMEEPPLPPATEPVQDSETLVDASEGNLGEPLSPPAVDAGTQGDPIDVPTLGGAKEAPGGINDGAAEGQVVLGPDPNQSITPPPLPEEVNTSSGIDDMPMQLPEPSNENVVSTPPVGQVAAAEESSLLTIVAIALLVIAIAIIVAIQIKKRRPKEVTEDVPPSLEFTQV